jgi:hypothetical protein
MKRIVLAGLIALSLASTAMAAGPNLRWNQIAGVITAQGVLNPICATDPQGNCVGTVINSGTFAWTTRSGSAAVNLNTGSVSFHVEGLVINGTRFSGTAGPIDQVEGTLVCNLGGAGEALIDTPSVPLSHEGDADFSGHVNGVPTFCDNPLFLIRIANPFALGRWIATGVEGGTRGSTSLHGASGRD